MTSTTVRVYSVEKERLDYYKGVFGFSGMQETIKAIMDRSGLLSLEEIKKQRVIMRVRKMGDGKE